MSYKIGDRVVFMHEPGGGIIKSVDGTIFMIEDDDGFNRPFHINDIAPVSRSKKKVPIDLTVLQEESIDASKTIRGERISGSTWEIDLHIEELVDSHHGWSNSQILEKQMFHFRQFFQRVCIKRVPKFVVIHGVGQGVLRSAIHEFLRKEEGCEYHDADFREYGRGATKVLIRHTERH